MLELEAINIQLAAVQMSPVSNLEEKSSELTYAIPILDQTRKNILKKGWACNTDVKTLTPDAVSGGIAISPTTYFDVRAPSHLREKLVIRNGKLWDRTTQTNWDEAVELCVILNLTFEQIPEHLAEYIAREAAWKLDLRVNGDRANPHNKRDSDMARIFAHNNLSERGTLARISRFPAVIAGYSQ